MAIHKCLDCGQCFDKPARLNRHRLQHTGERPFKCTWVGCDKTYQRKDHLDRHIRAEHEGSRPLHCDYPGCDSAFYEQSHLKRHKLTHFKSGDEGAGAGATASAEVHAVSPADKAGKGKGKGKQTPASEATHGAGAQPSGSDKGRGKGVSRADSSRRRTGRASHEGHGAAAAAVEAKEDTDYLQTSYITGASAGYGDGDAEAAGGETADGRAAEAEDGSAARPGIHTRKRGRHQAGTYALVAAAGVTPLLATQPARKMAKIGAKVESATAVAVSADDAAAAGAAGSGAAGGHQHGQAEAQWYGVSHAAVPSRKSSTASYSHGRPSSTRNHAHGSSEQHGSSGGLAEGPVAMAGHSEAVLHGYGRLAMPMPMAMGMPAGGYDGMAYGAYGLAAPAMLHMPGPWADMHGSGGMVPGAMGTMAMQAMPGMGHVPMTMWHGSGAAIPTHTMHASGAMGYDYSSGQYIGSAADAYGLGLEAAGHMHAAQQLAQGHRARAGSAGQGSASSRDAGSAAAYGRGRAGSKDARTKHGGVAGPGAQGGAAASSSAAASRRDANGNGTAANDDAGHTDALDAVDADDLHEAVDDRDAIEARAGAAADDDLDEDDEDDPMGSPVPDRTHDRLDEGAILAASMKDPDALDLQPALESTFFACPFPDCDPTRRFPKRSDLKAHWNEVHPGDAPTCRLCGAYINNVNAMKAHGGGVGQCGPKIQAKLAALRASGAGGADGQRGLRTRGLSMASYGARSEGELTVALRGGVGVTSSSSWPAGGPSAAATGAAPAAATRADARSTETGAGGKTAGSSKVDPVGPAFTPGFLLTEPDARDDNSAASGGRHPSVASGAGQDHGQPHTTTDTATGSDGAAGLQAVKRSRAASVSFSVVDDVVSGPHHAQAQLVGPPAIMTASQLAQGSGAQTAGVHVSPRSQAGGAAGAGGSSSMAGPHAHGSLPGLGRAHNGSATDLRLAAQVSGAQPWIDGHAVASSAIGSVGVPGPAGVSYGRSAPVGLGLSLPQPSRPRISSTGSGHGLPGLHGAALVGPADFGSHLPGSSMGYLPMGGQAMVAGLGPGTGGWPALGLATSGAGPHMLGQPYMGSGPLGMPMPGLAMGQSGPVSLPPRMRARSGSGHSLGLGLGMI